MLKKALALFFCLSIIYTSFSQDDLELLLTEKYAENSFREGDFEFALENYLILYEKDKLNIDLNYKIGICYTETTIDKSMAIPFLEFVVSHNNYPIKSYYYLGRAYMYNYMFTVAVEAFYEYKMMGVSEETLRESDRLIQMCYYALEMINVPRNVTFELLDSTVNSKFDEYYPHIDANANTLLFSSNRKYVPEYEEYIANVFYSDQKKGVWSAAVPLSTNTFDNEEVVAMTPNGENILIYANGDYANNDIKMVHRKGTKFTNATNTELPFDMNTAGIEQGACLAPNGNTIYFASDKRGGRGGLDIYYAKKDAGGKWLPAENIGDMINTEFDENFPALSADGKTLYFASKGHKGIGEYDLFETTYIDSLRTWGLIKNLGCPINTPQNNTTISFAADGKTAYLATTRKEGFGKLDIYKVSFGDDNKSVIIMVTLMIGAQTNAVPYSEDFLKAYGTFFDKYGNIIAQSPVGTDGNFFGTLFPGTYKLEVKFEGAKEGYSEIIEIGEDKVGGFISSTVYLKQ